MHLRNFFIILSAMALLLGLRWAQCYRTIANDAALPAEAAGPRSEPTLPVVLTPAAAVRNLSQGPLPSRDLRWEAEPICQLSGTRAAAIAALKQAVPANVELDPISGSARWIASNAATLTMGGAPVGDARAVVSRFLSAHATLMGHGAGVLESAREVSSDANARFGTHKLVWHQQLDGVDVFEAVLQANVAADGALINIGSQMLADPEAAAGPARQDLLTAQPVTAAQAVAAAGQEVGDKVTAQTVRATAPPDPGPDRRQRFRAALLTDAEAKLIWVPMSPTTLRLAWDVTLTSRARAEMYRVLVDAQTAEVLVRHSMTAYLGEASYRVFTGESPTPFSPGHRTPSNLQPPIVPRALVTTPALNPTASPAGWINDGVTITSGNNVDAYADANGDNAADAPRVQGGPNRTFDFPLDLNLAPSTYRSASVTQLFYWTNYAHDRLYDFGFTEAAGNFQVTNFGRGGAGNDPVLAEAQDGSGTNNANFSTPLDGGRGRMQMFLWTDSTPDRDGAFDAEVVLHEYCHGLSNRLVGGPSVTISALVSQGLGEGWSDFYSLALTAEAGDNPHGNWARAGYSKYHTGGWYSENYYFGTRRYSYSTDLTKNPLTFKDIDPKKVDWHTEVPRNPTFPATQDTTQVHYQGTVWCALLWELRANLIFKHGFNIGNDRSLFLVTQGMKFTPANPNFIQARDGIIQATQVHHAEDLGEVWTAFAKRGLGRDATAPASSTTTGVIESYTVPDTLEIDDRSGWNITGEAGGNFSPATKALTLRNLGAQVLPWSVTPNAAWLSASPSHGTLAPGETAMVILGAHADNLRPGFHATNVVFANQASGFNQPIGVRLEVSPPALQSFSLDTDPGWARSGEWAFGAPAGAGGNTLSKPDPKTGATGATVFGANLKGNVSAALTGAQYLTMGPLNLSEVRGARLRFMRWLNVNSVTNCRVTVEVSSNGSVWREVFVNPASVTAECAWRTMEYDIAAVADGQQTVFVRWSYRNLSAPGAYTGWNIDDVEILGESTGTLSVELAGTVSEAGGAVTGRLILAKAFAEPTTVALACSDPSLAAVVGNVVFAAGETDKEFTFTPVNNDDLEGTRCLEVIASSSHLSSRTARVTILDDEMADIVLALPSQGVEGGRVAGTITLSRAPARDLSIQLISNHASLVPPPALVIPAGETGPVEFECELADNIWVEGARDARLTAIVAGWAPAGAGISIADNDVPSLIFEGPERAREGDPVQPMTIAVNLAPAANLVVKLSSRDNSQIKLPASVTIPAGRTSMNFNATVVNDTVADGVSETTLAAKAAGYADGIHTVQVADNEVDHYTFESIPSPQRIKRTAPVIITARDVEGEIITNHIGTVTLKAVSPAGPVPVTFGRLSAFSGGVARGTVSASKSVANVTLTATDVRARKGMSNPFNIEPGAHAAFAWSGLPVAAVAQDVPFNAKLTALDDSGSLAANYTTQTPVEACAPVIDCLVGGSGAEAATDKVYNTAAHDARAQILYTTAELGGEPRWLGALKFDLLAVGGQAMRTFTLRLKHTDETSFEGHGWEEAGWTTVYTGGSVAAATEFFAFTTPFHYNGTQNLMVEISFNNTTASRSGTVRCTTVGNCRMLTAVSNSLEGAPLSWSNAAGPEPQACSEVPVLEVYAVQSLGPIPASPVTPMAGVWSGAAFAPTGVCQAVWLLAQAPSGIFAFSPRVTLTATPAPIAPTGIVFSENFESGLLGPAWSTQANNGATSRTRVTTAGVPRGRYHLTMDAAATAPGQPARNSPTLTVNLAGRRNVSLEWRAKAFGGEPDAPLLTGPMGAFDGHANFDGVAISADGLTWVEVAPLRGLTSAYPTAANRVFLDPIIQRLGWKYHEAFQIRFAQYSHSAISNDGIGIDDILVKANPLTTITVALPAQVAEGTRDLVVTVTLPTPAAANTAVTLTSNSPARLTLRSPVVVPAGQTTATTVISAPQNQYLDLGKAVMVNATARGYVGAPSHTRVVDDEQAVISMSMPTAVNESGSFATGFVMLSQMAAAPVQVFLESSDSGRLTVSNVATIPFGADSAPFSLQASQATHTAESGIVFVTATGEGLMPASAVVDLGGGEPSASPP